MKKVLFFLSVMIIAGWKTDAQNINTVAGSALSTLGDGGQATSAQLNPSSLGFDAAGNFYVSDFINHRIRKVTVSTGIITTYAGTGTGAFSGDGGPANLAELKNPGGMVMDASGNIYFSDFYNHRVRKITVSTGIITTVAGKTGSGFTGDGVAATTSALYGPMGIALDAAGNLYIAEFYNNRVRKVTASTGIISTVAGTGGNGFNGDGILATTADVFGPTDVAVDASGNIYIAENQNARLRKVNASTGMISTVAGNGAYGFSGDGGPATAAQAMPVGLTLDAAGNILFSCHHRVRKINISTGVINTIAGDGNNGFAGDGGLATSAQLAITGIGCDIAVDASGNIYICDGGNGRVRKISSGVITGIPTNHSSSETLLYPNPFTAFALLSFPEEQENATVSITDAQGREIRKQEFSGKTYTIEKGELSAGIYFLLVRATNGTAISRKFVIE